MPPADAHSSPGPKGWRRLPWHPHLSPSHEKHTQPQEDLREGKKRSQPQRGERETGDPQAVWAGEAPPPQEPTTYLGLRSCTLG